MHFAWKDRPVTRHSEKRKLVESGNKFCYTFSIIPHHYPGKKPKMEDEIFRLMTEFLEKQETLNEISHPEDLSGYSTTELHVLKKICESENANGTFLAKILHLTKGAISKTVRKLAVKQLIEPYRQSGNRQRVYYRVTPAGKEIYEKHEMRENGWKRVNHAFLSGLTDEQRQNAAHYLQKYNAFLERMIGRETG